MLKLNRKTKYVFFTSKEYRRLQLSLRYRQLANQLVSICLPSFAAISLLFVPTAGATGAPLILGEVSYQKYYTHQLTDRAQILVNVSDGNMILQTEDLNINGTGPALSISRYFNDLGSGSGAVGSRNTLSVGPDVHITANANGSATYQGPSGFQAIYNSNGSGGYTTPASYTDATMAPVSGGGWTLTFNKSGEVYTFNAAGNQTKDASANGEAINYAYNANNTLASATDTQGRVTTFTNYSGTNVGTVTDSTGRAVNYTYTSGQLTGVTDAMSKTWQFQYTGTNNNLTQITDPRGYITTIAYDGSNRATGITYNATTSAATTYTISYSGGNTAVVDPLNHNTGYWYDSSGRVTSIKDAVGNFYNSSYDANNNQQTSVSPDNYTTNYTYDTLNNLKSIQNPTLASGAAGAQKQFTYGSTAHPYSPSQGTDTQGNLITYSYNTNGNVIQSSSSSAGGTGMGSSYNYLQGDPNGSGGTYNCGAQPGEICSSKDANGNTTTYGYDSHGNVTSITPPGPVTAKTITYDALARPATVTDGNGSKRTFTYDNFDRPTSIVYATGGSSQTYTYDADGNLTKRIDSAGQTDWVFDGYNRVTQLKQTGQANLNYTYDNAGNLHTEQGPAGTITYTYDNANEVQDIIQSVNNADEKFDFTNGRPTKISLPGGVTETISYDRDGRETSIVATKGTTTLTSFTGSYTTSSGVDTGLLQTVTNGVSGVTTNYSYDGMNRLTGASGTGTGANSYTYSYDSNGNRTQTSTNGTSSPTYGFNTANELTTSGGTAYSTYDQAGNQKTTGAGLSMLYNAKNQTNSFTTSGSATYAAAYTDGDQQNRTQFGSTTEQNGLLGLYSDTVSTTNTYFTHLPTGTHQVLGEMIGTTQYYYLTDLQGSVVAVTDSGGNIANTYKYDPYGNIASSTGTVANPYKYDGGYQDATGLYKLGERYYNATDARWTQLDPSGQNAGYQFAGDDPVNQVDPSGYVSVSGLLVAYGGGCLQGAASTFALAGVVAAAGGQVELTPLILGLGCAIGGANATFGALNNPAGQSATSSLDTYLTLTGF